MATLIAMLRIKTFDLFGDWSATEDNGWNTKNTKINRE
jgi:hypothetical protein